MAYKQFALDERTTVTIYKRRSSRSLKLTVAADGRIKVSVPAWVPYKAGLEFAKSKQDWILQQQKPTRILKHGQAIGKAHHLAFIPHPSRQKSSSRIQDSEVTVTYPAAVTPNHPSVQKAAHAASLRALRLQAEQLLPQRLAQLAAQHEFDYTDVTIKRLKARWGSCDQNRHIVLNLYLMQLPWELIDYVLLHELTHTQILRHGPDFWQAMERVLPAVKSLKRQLREHQPVLV